MWREINSCLRRIKSCRRALTRITAATVVNSLIVTGLDYCNSLLAGCTKQTLDKLQRVLNCTVRFIFGGDSRHHIICTGCGQGNASRSESAHWCTRKCTAWHHRIWTRCAFQIPLFPNFLLSAPLLVVIWSYPEQGYNSATGHFVWLVQSPGTLYPWTFVRHLHYQRSKTCSRHIYSHVPTSLINCLSMSSEHCTAPL